MTTPVGNWTPEWGKDRFPGKSAEERMKIWEREVAEFEAAQGGDLGRDADKKAEKKAARRQRGAQAGAVTGQVLGGSQLAATGQAAAGIMGASSPNQLMQGIQKGDSPLVAAQRAAAEKSRQFAGRMQTDAQRGKQIAGRSEYVEADKEAAMKGASKTAQNIAAMSGAAGGAAAALEGRQIETPDIQPFMARADEQHQRAVDIQEGAEAMEKVAIAEEGEAEDMAREEREMAERNARMQALTTAAGGRAAGQGGGAAAGGDDQEATNKTADGKTSGPGTAEELTDRITRALTGLPERANRAQLQDMGENAIRDFWTLVQNVPNIDNIPFNQLPPVAMNAWNEFRKAVGTITPAINPDPRYSDLGSDRRIKKLIVRKRTVSDERTKNLIKTLHRRF
jgi:hypothetical protein